MASKQRPVKNTKQTKTIKKKRKTSLTVLLAVAITALVSAAVIGIYFLVFAVSFVNGESKINLEEYKQNQDQTTFIYAYDANDEPFELTRLHGEQNRIWVAYNETDPEASVIPQNLANAYIALEDVRFRKHDGVDWSRTISATAENIVKKILHKGKGSGGSTLTQQLIKNLTGENERILSRKFYEILLALNLEKNVSKETILEAYMNTVYMSHGCYGVQTASENYFGKNVQDLNLAECAALASITKAPSANDPLSHPEKNRARQVYCLDNMLKEGYITQEEHDEAIAYEMIFTNSDNYVASGELESSKNQTEKKIQSYYVDYVVQSVIADLVSQYNMSKSQASSMIYSGGLRIYCAVDTNVQEAMESVFVNRTSFPNIKKGYEDAQSAMTIMNYNGRIVGMVGGAGEKTQNRSLNRAANSPRQPGSSIKPLTIYAPAVENKYVTWSTLVKNYGIDHYYKDGTPGPHNYGNDPGSPDSYVNVQKAICKSYNTVPAQLAKQMGFKKCYDFATEKFHLSHFVEADINASSLAVGGTHSGVTTLEMAAAYAAFGNGGKYFKPYCYYKVTNSNGDVLLQNAAEPEGEQIMAPESADIMNELLQTVITDVAGKATGRGYALKNATLFAKTGTTSEDKDRWFVGGTPNYVAAVWFGCDQPKPVSAFIGGGNPAGKIFDSVMNKVQKDIKRVDFEKHSPLAEQHAYCTKTGLLAGANCDSKAMGWYSKNNLPGTCVSCAGAAAPEAEGQAEAATPETPQEGETSAPTTAPAAEATTKPDSEKKPQAGRIQRRYYTP